MEIGGSGMKKVCHMTSVHCRNDVRIFLKECCSLTNAGYDVTLLCADNQPDELIDGVKITSVNFHPQTRIQRILGAKKVMLESALKVDADIYHFHDPELLPMGVKLKKLGKKVIFDSHEDVPQQIMGKYWIPKLVRYPISTIYKIYEKYCVKKFDAILSVTPHIVDRFKQLNANTIIITNYPILNKEPKLLSSEQDKSICFAGGICEQWMHENIIQALGKVAGASYLLAGTGDIGYINKLKSLTMWDRVNYKGYIKQSEVFDLYNQSMAGIALCDYVSNVGFKIGTFGSTKIFEYMYAGLPVICTDFVLWKDIIEKNHCGICVNPNDTNAIANAINYLIDNPNEAQRMGENGRKAVLEKYNWESQEKILLELYNKLN
jgi:glycosyltransferase involved in cell wall biosynthesis